MPHPTRPSLDPRKLYVANTRDFYLVEPNSAIRKNWNPRKFLALRYVNVVQTLLFAGANYGTISIVEVAHFTAMNAGNGLRSNMNVANIIFKILRNFRYSRKKKKEKEKRKEKKKKRKKWKRKEKFPYSDSFIIVKVLQNLLLRINFLPEMFKTNY